MSLPIYLYEGLPDGRVSVIGFCFLSFEYENQKKNTQFSLLIFYFIFKLELAIYHSV